MSNWVLLSIVAGALSIFSAVIAVIFDFGQRFKKKTGRKQSMNEIEIEMERHEEFITKEEHEQEITKIKYQIGRKVLGVSMLAMGIFVFVDLLASTTANLESDLIKNAFEAFKLITMTVLGYVFGSNDLKK